MNEYGHLLVVGTPLGNIEDITFRAMRVLKGAEIIVCEDTRVTARLLQQLEKLPITGHKAVNKPLMVRLDEHTQMRMIPKVINWLKTGTSVVLTTDAGMPTISDPGWRVVDMIQDEGFKVEVIPGPTALTTALAASGMDAAKCWFVGFLAKKDKKRMEQYQEMGRQLREEVSTAVVFYESPNRIKNVLTEMSGILPDVKVAACGELTKMHEKVIRGKILEVIEMLPMEVKGEWAVVVGL